MVEYIDRQAAINALSRGSGCGASCHRALKTLPSADVQPVRHGHWQITDAYPHNVYCSECHMKCAQTHWAVWEDGSLPRNYCPNCGARMDGEKDE